MATVALTGIVAVPIPNAICFDNKPDNAPETISFPLYFHVNAPNAIAIVSSSISSANSNTPPITSDHFIFLIAVTSVVLIPSTHTLIVLANDLKSKFSKNPFIPLAIEFPKSAKSNVSPNDKVA